MKIKNASLVLVHDVANARVQCTAGCGVELDALETAALANPFHPGFRLRCQLLAGDPGTDPVIFTFPRAKLFKSVVDVLNLNQVFEEALGTELLDEDIDGADEIKARFTLVDLSNAKSKIKVSPTVSINL